MWSKSRSHRQGGVQICAVHLLFILIFFIPSHVMFLSCLSTVFILCSLSVFVHSFAWLTVDLPKYVIALHFFYCRVRILHVSLFADPWLEVFFVIISNYHVFLSCAFFRCFTIFPCCFMCFSVSWFMFDRVSYVAERPLTHFVCGLDVQNCSV